MNLEGKTCGVCDKGRLHRFTDEISKGVHVDAYKCDYAGHVSYDRNVMEKVEALYRQVAQERHVVKIGSSVAVPIPAGIAKSLNLKPKERVYVTSEDNKIIIHPSPS
ncbi:AbrB/MazE/SpoVT family DNA-binding domain-containing protein [Candidatus Micrarchaeota archaeon]|nr:AbrB/MazE/SpoVT family DNA-binding domain-containing protein [Candidatus Micrarchaeota archaeon]MBI5177158.1 AbrB/MazE/SpoVT family DNA-binding domain-containing protein [Candidatus Micrarchaeota archaeon]